MNKSQLIDLFGNEAELARFLGRSRSAVNLWPEDLPNKFADEVIGAMLRAGRFRPAYLAKKFPEYEGLQQDCPQ